MPERVLLEGDTLHIGFYGEGKAPYPEDIVTGGVLRALAQHLKVDLNTEGVFWGDYCFLSGVTGESFRFLELMKLDTWPENQPLVERYGLMTRAESFRQALDAAGLRSQVYTKADLPEKAALQQQIVESLAQRKTPVIAFGVFGAPEPFLVTGYDNGGEILLGWSHLQKEKANDRNVSFEPTGEFRLENWYGLIDGAIIVTGTGERPALRGIYRNALERGMAELQVTRSGDGAVGTAAMEKWAQHLERDSDFAGLSSEQLKKAHEMHGATAGDLAERRALASSFIELATRVFPDAAPDLATAGACFQGSHDTVYEIWETVAKTGPFDPDIEKFMDPERRRTMAGLVRRLADFDRRAVLALGRAIKIIDGKQPGEEMPANDLLDGKVYLQKAEQPAATRIWAPENIAIANSMCMLQEFLGEPFGELNDAEKGNNKLAYTLWLGYTGAAFGMLEDTAERSNLPLAFDALGYDYELWVHPEMAGSFAVPSRSYGWDDNFRRRVFWNLRDRKLPVLLFNCGAWPDWWLVTQVEHWWDFRGYGGNDGEGYRPNEALDDAKNPLREIALIESMKGKRTWAINVTAKRPAAKPSMEQLYERAIQWGARRMQEPRMTVLDAGGGERMSAKPYRDWADMMRTDALFPADDPAVLKSRRSRLEGYEAELAERRHYGAGFLELASIRLARPELKQAADHFRNAYKLVEEIWAQTGGMQAADGHLKYADKAVRAKIADLLLEIEREDAAAARLLAQ